MCGDRGVPRELAPSDQARLDRVVALLRVALGLGEIDRPPEPVGEPAPHQLVELRLQGSARLSRGVVARERDREPGAARAGRCMPSPIGSEALA